jgi:hypothetical protein
VSWRARIAIAAALAALVAASFAMRWGVLAGSPYPIGVDGFFYPIQVRSLLAHGSLVYPASPLTFWWMAPFAAITDPITGAKLGAALGGALIAIPAFGVGARLGKGVGAGLVAAALATTSAGSAYLSIEFVKQGIGLTVALAALWLILRMLEAPSRRRVILAIGGVSATLLAHKLAAGVLVAIAIPAAWWEARARLFGRRLLYATAGAVLLAVVVLGLGLAAPQRFVSPDDLALVRALVTTRARWSDPVLATRTFTLTMEHEALIGAFVALAAAVALLLGPKRRPSERVTGWAFVGLGLVLGLPWLDVADPQGLAFRLRIAAFVPLASNAALTAGAIPMARIVAWAATVLGRRGLGEAALTAAATAAFAGLALVLALCGLHERTEGRILAHPALVAGAMAATERIPPGDTVIVPERHIAFMVAWYSGKPVSLRPESVPHDQRVRLLPLSFIGKGSPLEQAIDAARVEPGLAPPIGLHPHYRNGLVLVAEPTWDWILAQLPERDRHHFIRWPTI